jgi:hypothetical protein
MSGAGLRGIICVAKMLDRRCLSWVTLGPAGGVNAGPQFPRLRKRDREPLQSGSGQGAKSLRSSPLHGGREPMGRQPAEPRPENFSMSNTNHCQSAASAHDRRHNLAQAQPAHASSHISSCKRFAAWLKRSANTATPDEVRRFQLHLIESGASICNRNRIMTGYGSSAASRYVAV